MNLVPIDAATKALHARSEKYLSKPGAVRNWWHVSKLPEQAIEAVATGRGAIRKGKTVYLIGGHDREVFPDGKTKMEVHEYVGLVKGTSWQPLVQLGRDVHMV